MAKGIIQNQLTMSDHKKSEECHFDAYSVASSTSLMSRLSQKLKIKKTPSLPKKQKPPYEAAAAFSAIK